MTAVQLDLLGGPPVAVEPRARRTDPETSKLAAQQARAFAGTQCDLVHDMLLRRGPASKDQLAAWLDIDGVAVARRLSDLQHAGRAAPTGETRPSASGRAERVWRAIRPEAAA